MHQSSEKAEETDRPGRICQGSEEPFIGCLWSVTVSLKASSDGPVGAKCCLSTSLFTQNQAGTGRQVETVPSTSA